MPPVDGKPRLRLGADRLSGSCHPIHAMKNSPSTEVSPAKSPANAAEEAEPAGGPVKPFLDHLEDLRWLLLRCGIAVFLSMAVCLVAADRLMEILLHPLEQARARIVEREQNRPTDSRSDDRTAILPATWGKLDVDIAFNEADLAGLLRGGEPRESIPLALNLTESESGWTIQLAPQSSVDPQNPVPRLEQRSPLSPFMLAMKTAFFGGAAVALPLILSFLASFLFPALKPNEKRILSRAVFFGVGMFALGAAFAYFGMARVTILASLAFSEWLGFTPTIWFVEDYAGFLIKLVFGVGLAFELPVILLTMVRLGVINHNSLKAFRPYWVAVNLIVSPLLTPQDVITQLMLAIPLQLLYELSVLIAWKWHRSEQSGV